MIRVFELFRKSNLITMSATLIQQYTAEFNPSGQICPSCGAKHPDWKRHGIYLRNLIMFEDGSVVPHLIAITRFRCSSCGHTHAMLPSLLIPFQSYSLLFLKILEGLVFLLHHLGWERPLLYAALQRVLTQIYLK